MVKLLTDLISNETVSLSFDLVLVAIFETAQIDCEGGDSLLHNLLDNFFEVSDFEKVDITRLKRKENVRVSH